MHILCENIVFWLQIHRSRPLERLHIVLLLWFCANGGIQMGIGIQKANPGLRVTKPMSFILLFSNLSAFSKHMIGLTLRLRYRVTHISIIRHPGQSIVAGIYPKHWLMDHYPDLIMMMRSIWKKIHNHQDKNGWGVATQPHILHEIWLWE